MLRSLQGTIRPLELDRKTKCECCNEKHKKGYSVDIAQNYSLWFCEPCGGHIYNRCNPESEQIDMSQSYLERIVQGAKGEM